MDLTMRYGGDESCFLFNLTQNMRFDTLKNQQDLPGDIPIYAMTTTQGFDDEDDLSNDLSETDNNIEGEGSPSEQEDSNSDDDDDIDRNSRESGEGAKKKYKKNLLKNNGNRKRGVPGAANKMP